MESGLVDEEQMYLDMEISNIESNVTMSVETFKMCSENATMIFNDNFQKFQATIQACTAIWSWLRFLNRSAM